MFSDINESDLTNFKNLESNISKILHFLIINCASYTSADADIAKSEKELSNILNIKAVDLIPKWTFDNNKKLINIYIDHVFEGNSKNPLNKVALTAPINYYGFTK